MTIKVGDWAGSYRCYKVTYGRFSRIIHYVFEGGRGGMLESEWLRLRKEFKNR